MIPLQSDIIKHKTKLKINKLKINKNKIKLPFKTMLKLTVFPSIVYIGLGQK